MTGSLLQKVKRPLSIDKLKIDRALLVVARGHIESRTEQFVCFAITRALNNFRDRAKGDRIHYTYYEASERLDHWIDSQLNGMIYYESWMRKYHTRMWDAVWPDESREYARDARLRWIDWMIGEIDREIVVAMDRAVLWTYL